MAKITKISDNFGKHKGQLDNNDVSDDNSLQIRGTAKPGQQVNIYKNDELIGSVKANGSGIWRFKAENLEEGAVAFTTTTLNGKGRESAPSKAFNLTIDKSAEVANDISLEDANGQLSSGGNSQDGKLTITGKAEAGAKVEILDGNKVIAMVVADKTGNWSTDVSLKDGSHELSTKVTDVAGNRSELSSVTNIDVGNSQANPPTGNNSAPVNVAPPVVLPPGTQVVEDGFRNDNTPIIIGNATPGAEVTMTVGPTTYGPVTADANGRWEIEVTVALPEGESIFAAKATNSVGDAYIGYSLIIDTEAPDVPTIDFGADNVGALQDDLQHKDHTDDDTVTLHGSGEIGSFITIYDGQQFLGFASVVDDGNGNGVWSYTPTISLNEGNHDFTAFALDAAGNLSGESDKFTVTIDRTIEAPVIKHLIDDQGKDKGKVNHKQTTDDAKPLIVGTAEAGATVTVKLNGKELGTTTANKKGEWTLAVDKGLKEGGHKITAEQTDKAGNESGSSTTFKFTVKLNAGPEANDDNFNVRGETTLDVLKNDSDPDGDKLIITKIVSQPTHGSVQITNAGKLLYTPDTISNTVNDTITYKISDGKGGTSTATVTLNVEPELDTPTIDLASSSDSGWYDWDNVTNDTTALLKGTAQANSTVALYRDGVKIADVSVNGNGDWEYNTPYRSNGNYNYHVTSEGFGLSLDSSTLRVTVDTYINAYVNQAGAGMEWQIPTAGLYSLALTTNETVRYTMTGSDTVTGTLYSSGNSSGFNFTQAYSTLSYVNVRFEDIAGNISNSSTSVRHGAAPPIPPRHYDPIAALDDGGYIVSFAKLSDVEENGFDIYAQRYNAAGEKVGKAFLVNQELDGNQTHSDAVGLDDGGFVLTWQSEGQDGDLHGVYARKYNAEGQAVSDEILINEYTENDQSLAEVTATENGGFAVTWMSDQQDGSGLGVYMKIYDANGEATTDDIQVSDDVTAHQAIPSITTLDNGNIVITWQDHRAGGTGEIRASVFSPAGDLLSDSFAVSPNGLPQQWSFVSALEDGGFAVSWHETNQHGESAVMIQSFDEDGQALNEEPFFVADAFVDSQSEIAGLKDGNILVSWIDEDDDQSGVFFSIVSPTGEVISEAALVNQEQAGQQVESHSLSLEGGGFLITWVEIDDEGQLVDVHGQQFDADGKLVGDNFIVSNDETSSDINLLDQDSGVNVPVDSPDPLQTLNEGENDTWIEPLTPQGDEALFFEDLLASAHSEFELSSIFANFGDADQNWSNQNLSGQSGSSPSYSSHSDLADLRLAMEEMSQFDDYQMINNII